MAVSARFKVSRITPNNVKSFDDDGNPLEYEQAEVEMTPDYADGKNKEWSRWTPAGVFRLQIKEPLASESFELGQSVEIVISPVTE